MGINSKALYLNLLQDLQAQFPDTDFTVGEEWPGMSPRERQASALRTSLLKKFKDEKESTADDAALALFLQSNIQCRDWDLELNTSGDEVLVGQFRKILNDFFNPRGYPLLGDFSQIARLGRVGPGASVGATGKDFFTKLFSSPLACTDKGLWTLYQHYVCNYPTWSRAENARYSEYGEPDIVAGNRLSFVDKNATISRVICTEPSLNMFFQLGVGAVMEKRLLQFFGIDIRNQQVKNRELARVASLTGDLCTIDLSAASDSVSCRMLEYVLPPEVNRVLHRLRSPTVTLPSGNVEELHMISSMGNGFTFPLETIIFASVVAAVYELEGIPRRKTTYWWDLPPAQLARAYGERRKYGEYAPERPRKPIWKYGNFGIFGDDIIADSSASRKIVRLLSILGFSVNRDKSFFEGPFRESCGADYFDGQPVRGVYIKSLKTQASRYVAINRLNQWSAVTNIRLSRTVGYLMKGVRKLYVPLDENDDAGIKVPSSLTPVLGCERRGHYANTAGPIHGTVRYKAWLPRSTQLRIDIEKEVIRGAGRRRFYNDNGLFLAYLRGDIINCRWTVRTNFPKYSARWKTTPYWDSVPTVGQQCPIGSKALAKAIESNVC